MKDGFLGGADGRSHWFDSWRCKGRVGGSGEGDTKRESWLDVKKGDGEAILGRSC